VIAPFRPRTHGRDSDAGPQRIGLAPGADLGDLDLGGAADLGVLLVVVPSPSPLDHSAATFFRSLVLEVAAAL
jgi:hypothetical protein